ncbi:Conserved_hypothetical protein [Hexamita inflata]|uniref:Uncharacterized protein n=1 Tax=Hexamita inflata TaxID=28002 RepID=A0ABP1HWG7_9EUKA
MWLIASIITQADLETQLLQDTQVQQTIQSYVMSVFNSISKQTQQKRTMQIGQQLRLRNYLNTRQNFSGLQELQINNLINIAEQVNCEYPILNRTQVYDQFYNSEVDTTKIMQTYQNQYSSQKSHTEECTICGSLYEHIKPIQQNQKDNMLIYDEITIIDKNLNTFTYPYNKQQPEYDARQTMGRFAFNIMNQVDIYIDLNMDQQELELSKLLIIDIVNMVTMNTSIHIYTIGSNIQEIFYDSSDYIQLELILASFKTSQHSSVNFEELLHVFHNNYENNTNITISFIITRGIDGNIHNTKLNSTNFVLINPYFVKPFKYISIQNITCKYIYTIIQQYKSLLFKQQELIKINIKSLNASYIYLNQESNTFYSIRQVNDFFKLQIHNVLLNYLDKAVFLSNLVTASQTFNHDLAVYFVKAIIVDDEYQGLVAISARQDVSWQEIMTFNDDSINSNCFPVTNNTLHSDIQQQKIYLNRMSNTNQQGFRPFISQMDQQQKQLQYGEAIANGLILNSFVMRKVKVSQAFINTLMVDDVFRRQKSQNHYSDREAPLVLDSTTFNKTLNYLVSNHYQSQNGRFYESTSLSMNRQVLTVMSDEFFEQNSFKPLYEIDMQSSEVMKFDDCSFFKQRFGVNYCLDELDSEINVKIPLSLVNFYQQINGTIYQIPKRSMYNSKYLKQVEQLPVSQFLSNHNITLEDGMLLEVTNNIAFYLKICRLVHQYLRILQPKKVQQCANIRYSMIQVCTKTVGNQPAVQFINLKQLDHKHFFHNNVQLMPSNQLYIQESNCVSHYNFDDTVNIIYNPIQQNSEIAYSKFVNNIQYWQQHRLVGSNQKVYIDILKPRSFIDINFMFNDDQQTLYINQFGMFIAFPKQYSVLSPKFIVSQQNMLESTICQPQKMSRKLLRILFQHDLVQLYYRLEGGRYCLQTQMLNITGKQTIHNGTFKLELTQLPQTGIYKIEVIEGNINDFLKDNTLAKCFNFVDDLNKYLDDVMFKLYDLKFQYGNVDYKFSDIYQWKQWVQATHSPINIKVRHNHYLVNSVVIILFLALWLISLYNQN